MKILTVTIKNYRVHGNLTVDFDRSRTVIGGPNESGKSTLVEAVHNAFFLRSRVTGAAHKAMLSEFHAGHPTVELRFESGGREYTITKVFTGNQSASTTLKDQPITRDGHDAAAGQAAGERTSGGGGAGAGRTLRDDEAEARIHEILQAEEVSGGRSLENRLRMVWAHLWIWQGSSTDDPLAHANADRHSHLLRERLSRVEGGGVLESELDAAAARDVADRQAATFTDKGKPRAAMRLPPSKRLTRRSTRSKPPAGRSPPATRRSPRPARSSRRYGPDSGRRRNLACRSPRNRLPQQRPRPPMPRRCGPTPRSSPAVRKSPPSRRG